MNAVWCQMNRVIADRLTSATPAQTRGRRINRGARFSAVTATVAGTAAAGALLSFLRSRSGSLVAPVLLHLAANCTAPLASALARTLDR